MCPRFEEWKDSIRDYCEKNQLDFLKASTMVKCSNKDMLVLQYHDPSKGNDGLLDETPMPVVLWVFRQQNGLRFEQTEYTKKYLAS